MTVSDSKNAGTAWHRLWPLIKKVLIGATLLFIISKLGNTLSRKTGWTSWGKFDTSITRFDSLLLQEIARATPISLYYHIKTTRTIGVVDTAATYAVDRYNEERQRRLISGEHPLQVPPQKFYPDVSFRSITVWEKMKSWGAGFWYDDDQTANWFGRILLFLSLSWAISLTWKRESSLFLSTGLYPVNIVVALIYLTFFCLILYVINTLLLFIAGSIVALYSSFVTTGSFLYYLVKELKSQTIDHSKSKVEPLLNSVARKNNI